MNGKVIKYHQKNIDTDLIIPARYLVSKELDFLANHCMEDLDPDFVKKVNENNYSILVADSNFGCGSSREQAPLALKASGIKCIIAPSFARIFFRNSINIGLHIVELSDIDDIKTGDVLKINLKLGEINNITSLRYYTVKKQPVFLQEIISDGGLVNYAKKRLIV
ncbi:MAG: 3-isopropylmalate dehydratase small subunit [Promethearchaeota archaeon]|jgi:3-isopropylmalate/(R)-2-methylmalate dehydratase small subunit